MWSVSLSQLIWKHSELAYVCAPAAQTDSGDGQGQQQRCCISAESRAETKMASQGGVVCKPHLTTAKVDSLNARSVGAGLTQDIVRLDILVGHAFGADLQRGMRISWTTFGPATS